MRFRFRFVWPLVSFPFLGCGSTGRAVTTDAGVEAAAPYEAGVDAGYDAPYDAPIEAASLRDASAPAMLLFSGDGEGFYDDTWEWSGTTWTQIQVASPGSADPSSLGRSQHAMAGLGGKVVLFGGQANPKETDLADTWTWDGLGWAQVNVTGPPARGARGRAGALAIRYVGLGRRHMDAAAGRRAGGKAGVHARFAVRLPGQR